MALKRVEAEDRIGAFCDLCGEMTRAFKYVRAAPMVPTGEREGRIVYSNAPNDEHGLYCLAHGRGVIEEAIASDHNPRDGHPVSLLWNPGRGDFRMEARRQRVRESLAQSLPALGHALESVVQTVTMHEDASKGVIVSRSAPHITLGRGAVRSPDGLRAVVVQDRGALHMGLLALLGEQEGNGF